VARGFTALAEVDWFDGSPGPVRSPDEVEPPSAVGVVGHFHDLALMPHTLDLISSADETRNPRKN
jgi:hypothetical protein